MKAHCISGLGADKRVFNNIEFTFDKVHFHFVINYSN